MSTRLLPSAALSFALALSRWASPVAAQAGESSREAEIHRRLRAFEDNPTRAMAEHLPKLDAHGRSVAPIRSPFTIEDIRSRQFVLKKDALRRKLRLIRDGVRLKLEQARPGRSAFERDDRAQDLVDIPAEQMLTTLENIEAAGLTQASLPESPWSDSYWPVYQGQIAARYADDRFTSIAGEDWSKFHNYVSSPQRSFRKIFATLVEGERTRYPIDDLSPAEKYDILVGDSDGLLTRANWQEGREYRNDQGKVETWMGLCHGWAAAAIMEARPSHAVTALAADGETRVTFYPSDIKALATELWANADTPSRYVGGRCEDKNPARDSNGRIISQECFDTNPGTWHLAVVNQLGKARRSFVIDATYDYEVWNQPVTAYKYTYFNPQTGEPVNDLDEARVTLSEYRKDKFRKYRSPDAKSIVGVAMDLTYVEESEPTHDEFDSPKKDQLRTLTYLYDLELNARGEIIGGEWRTNENPDFMWTTPVEARASSEADRLARGDWTPERAVPESWLPAARKASPYALPLAGIVQGLLKAAREGRE